MYYHLIYMATDLSPTLIQHVYTVSQPLLERPPSDRDPSGQRHPPDRDPPVNRITDRCKNITLPLRVVMTYLKKELSAKYWSV